MEGKPATAAAPRNDRENKNRPTRGRGVRVRERDLCTRSLNDDGPRKRAIESADELEAGPGRGPCPITRRFARRLGRRAKNQTNATSKARDRSGPALYKCMFSVTYDSTPSTLQTDRDVNTSAAAVASTRKRCQWNRARRGTLLTKRAAVRGQGHAALARNGALCRRLSSGSADLAGSRRMAGLHGVVRRRCRGNRPSCDVKSA